MQKEHGTGGLMSMSDVIKALEKNIETLEMLEKEYEKKAGSKTRK